MNIQMRPCKLLDAHLQISIHIIHAPLDSKFFKMFLMLYKNFQSQIQENGICLFIVFVFKMLFLWKQSIAKPLLFMVPNVSNLCPPPQVPSLYRYSLKSLIILLNCFNVVPKLTSKIFTILCIKRGKFRWSKMYHLIAPTQIRSIVKKHILKLFC